MPRKQVIKTDKIKSEYRKYNVMFRYSGFYNLKSILFFTSTDKMK